MMDMETFAKVRSMVRDADNESKKIDEAPVVSSISMKRSEKERFARLARDHNLTLSSFLRIAAEEYAQNHGWE